MPSTLLKMENIRKVFSGTIALNDLNFSLDRGEVHAVVGENGAGKSTLMKIISGAYRKTSGKILYEAEEVEFESVRDAQALGINMIYQELENIDKLTVAENIFLGRLPGGSIPGFISFKKLYRNTREILDQYSLDIRPESKLLSLSVAKQQFIEIIKAVTVKNAKVIIMDEPTSSLTKQEIEKLFHIIRELKKDHISIIYISHRLDEIVNIADRVSVFRDGCNVGTLAASEIEKHKIITMMIGHELEVSDKGHYESLENVLEIKNLNIKNRIRNFNLVLHKGEILGIAGLMGSGKDELVRSIFGLWPVQSIEIYYNRKRIRIKHPLDAIKKGIVYLPEERKVQSLFSEMSVKHNISIIWLFNIFKRFFLNRKKETVISNDFIKRLSVKSSHPNELIAKLSGGNQQKALFSRLIAANPNIMVLNDPTRGVDIQSKETIYGFIRELSRNGTSIILLSSELPEIIKLADRVLVLSRGEIKGEFSGDEISTTNILTCATGAAN